MQLRVTFCYMKLQYSFAGRTKISAESSRELTESNIERFGLASPESGRNAFTTTGSEQQSW